MTDFDFFRRRCAPLLACLFSCVLVFAGCADFESGADAPTYRVHFLSPEVAAVEGGGPVIIEGENFHPDEQVRVFFGNVEGAEVEVLNENQIRVVAPPHTPGPVDISLLGPGTRYEETTGVAQAWPGLFTYQSSVSPSQGPASGGTWVTLLSPEGNFVPSAIAFFGETEADAIVYLSEFVVRVLSPPHAPGDAPIRVEGAETVEFAEPFEYVSDSTTGEPGVVPSSDGPRIVSALASDNTHVRVTWSKALTSETASDPANYGIVTLYVNSEAGGLSVVDAELTESGRVVVLTTRAQAAVAYQITATGVRDVEGNSIAPPERLVNPAVTTFAGVGAAGPDSLDSDSDGISDADEQVGWTLQVTKTNGEVTTRSVVSNPDSADTDMDGLLDGIERSAGLDPTRADTDGDTISDFDEFNRYLSDGADQDTDGDGLGDPTELFFNTSIVLADTDGDQFSDFEEVIERQRNPRIADLPQPVLELGAVELALDVRYQYTDTEGASQSFTETVASSLQTEQSTQSTTYGQWTQNFEVGGSINVGAEWGTDGVETSLGIEAFGKYGKQWSGGTDVVSATSSIASLDSSIERATNLETLSTVERSVDGASVSVAVYLQAAGNVAFTLENLELSLLHGDASDRASLRPVATLVPANPDLRVNLGPDATRGPIIFTSREVFPSQVERLMRNPEAMVVRFANYDVVTEDGRNLAFVSQEVDERTGTIVVDYGNGTTEEYRVALSNEWDPRTGEPVGLRFTDAFRAIGIERGPCGGVIAGATECTMDAECAAIAGDASDPDAPVRCDTDGAFGVCVPADFCDDVLVVDSVSDPYQERSSADHDVEETFGMRILRGDDGAPLFGDDGAPRYDLVRIRGVQTLLEHAPVVSAPLATSRPDGWDGHARDTFLRRWVMVHDGEASADFSHLAFRPGDTYLLVFSADEDGDGLYKIEEDVFGTVDTDIDFDDDGLTDWEEVRGGSGPPQLTADGSRLIPNVVWRVETDRLSPYRVYPHPYSADSDGDGLSDAVEVLVESSSLTDPTDPTKIDSDGDGVDDMSEVHGWSYTDGNNASRGPFSTDPLDADHDGDGLVDGAERLWDTDPTIADVDTVSDSDRDGLPDSRDINCELPTAPPDYDDDGDNDGLSDVIEVLGLGTNPCDADTDSDGIPDGIDWDGAIDAAVEDICVNALHCSLPERGEDLLGTSPTNPDTDGDGLTDLEELTGWSVRILGSSPVGGGVRRVTSSPLLADTDDDGLSDFEEHSDRTDPRLADTDGDGLADANEGALGRDPSRPDRRIRIRFTWFDIVRTEDVDHSEWEFNSNIILPDGTVRSFANHLGARNTNPNFEYGDDQLRWCPAQANTWFAPGPADRFVFAGDDWNEVEVVIGLDQSVVLFGEVYEMGPHETAGHCPFYAHWRWGGPGTEDASISGDTADGTSIYFHSSGPGVDVFGREASGTELAVGFTVTVIE